jgi:manganese/iron transport system substrate-binding protein
MAAKRPRQAIAGLAVTAAIALLVAACGAPATPATTSGTGGPQPVVVVTTTTVFADMVRQVGGAHVSVSSLVPKGGDVHTFEPRPGDVQTVATAKVLFMNGLGLDDWLQKTITNAAASGTPVIKLGQDLPGVTLLPGEDPGTQNPHLWMDVKYGERYVARIAAALKAADPADAADFDARAAAYTARLETLDASIRARIATIPEADRRLVTFHDAFPYFAREYGIQIVGVAVEAPGQDPTAAFTARLIDAIKASGVKAIFSEAQFPTKLVDQLAAETGTKVVANLYDDSVGEPPADTYEGVIDWDATQLVDALR